MPKKSPTRRTARKKSPTRRTTRKKSPTRRKKSPKRKILPVRRPTQAKKQSIPISGRNLFFSSYFKAHGPNLVKANQAWKEISASDQKKWSETASQMAPFKM